MNAYTTYWLRWIDRLLLAVGLGALLLGVSVMDARANDRVVRDAPFPVVTYSDPRGNAVTVIESDGTVRFDYGGTIAWSRYFVSESLPARCRPVWVLTWINGPDGRRPLFLQACEPAPPRDAAAQ